MKFRDVTVGILGLLLLLAGSYFAEFLVSLETDRHTFPFIASWVVVLISVIGVLPGVVIGWLSKNCPLLIAIVLGLFVGIFEQATLYSSTLMEHADNAGIIGDPNIGDYIASGVAKAIYLCAFASLGVLLRTRVAR